MNLSRRILVMRQGRVAGELPRAQFGQAALMRLMAGMPEVAATEPGPIT
jgi:ABC-type sugar transport system ATPase subunit